MPIEPNRWTTKTREAFSAATEAARAANHPEVTPEHLLVAMLGQAETATLPTLEKVGGTPPPVRQRPAAPLARLPRSYGGNEPGMGRALRDAMERADAE